MAYIQKGIQIKKVQLNELSQSEHICITTILINSTPEGLCQLPNHYSYILPIRWLLF